ncbi:nitrite reductase small subunit NirD [Saccharibacillus sp. CPCC 101409]|uniref:nitrite reductase small subunit NirD n=1 Tax=Saccharibacillus sp. CPCC 101409 TaxID=3058041 RepID=UPI0026719988|nr:nitrite reductase small subunit NirD [Saccharibacillus sp. CPCC 101409]MDO3411628.1 nitrite reductase small subunit NirD [Saccharibacillus sp. CPCC 101409]
MSHSTEKVRVGRLSDIDPLGSRRLNVNGLEIALFRLSGGEILAVENRCPHKGGVLSEGMVCGPVVHCPLHDWRIDLRSGEALDPDKGCIETFATEVADDGTIFLTLNASPGAAESEPDSHIA